MRPENDDRNMRTVPCPRCGNEATWEPVDEQQVVVVCTDCGHLNAARTEIDRVEPDALWPEPEALP